MQIQEFNVARQNTTPDLASGVVPGDDRARNLEIILDVSKTISHSLILEEVLRLVLDHAIRVARAERGFLLLADDHKALQCALTRDATGRALETEDALYSRTVVEDVFASGESICVENAQLDDFYDRRASVRSLELQTILCSPLTVRDEKIGVLYVDSRHIQAVHRDEIIHLFEILAGQAATAIKNAQLYEQLRKAFAELESLNERLINFERLATKGEIAAEVSHELNNLLGVVAFQVTLFRRGAGRFTRKEMEERLDQMSEAVKKIAVFSTGLAESAHLTTKKVPGNFNECIREAVHFLKPLRKFRMASWMTEFDDRIPVVSFDHQQMQQIVLNLLNNAVEARPQVQIGVRTSFDQERNVVLLTVRDDGPGIEPEVMEKLFKEKVTTKPTGHGYGLPICRKIVENLGGTIQAASEQGRGAEFRIDIPIDG